jgi:hypothetical protein
MSTKTNLGHWVLVRIECRRCHASTDCCVRISPNVPTPLRCQPGGGAVVSPGAGNRCSCGVPWPWGPSDLSRVVEEEVRRNGWGRHMREGAVVLTF